MRYFGLILFVVIAFAGFDAPAGNIYTVEKIRVDERAGSAAAARNAAIFKGQQQALAIVLRRLTNVADASRLPDAFKIPPASIVQSFGVSDEKTSNKRYLATLKVTFKPDAVRNILRVHNIPISEVQAPPHLLLPVLETDKGMMLWGEHWWYKFWQSFDIVNIPTPLILPLGDIDDTRILSITALANNDVEKLWALAQRYQADAILVVRAREHKASNVVDDTALQLSSTLYGSLGGEVIVRRYVGATNREHLARYGTDELLTLLSERWKRVTTVKSDRETNIIAHAQYDGLDAWQKLLRGMEETTLIRDLQIQEISSSNAVLRMGFVGTPDQLAADLYRVGVLLVHEHNDWLLSNRPFIE